MLLGTGGFVVLVMVSSMILSAVIQVMESTIEIGVWMRWVTSLWTNLVLNWLALTVIYRTLPKPEIRWWNALRGGLVAAILWEVGRQALSAYLLHRNYPNVYGVIGSFLAVMLWAYYAALVVLFGAEYVRVIGEERHEQQELPLTG